VKDGESCLIMAGEPLGAAGVADHIMIHTIGDRPNQPNAERNDMKKI